MFRCCKQLFCLALLPRHWLLITAEPGHSITRTFNLSQFIIYSPSHARAVLKKPVKSYSENWTLHTSKQSRANSVAESSLKKQVPSQICTNEMLWPRQTDSQTPGTLREHRQHYCSTMHRILIRNPFLLQNIMSYKRDIAMQLMGRVIRGAR